MPPKTTRILHLRYVCNCLLCDTPVEVPSATKIVVICQECKNLIKYLKEERNAKQQRNLPDAESKTSEDR